MQTLSFIALCIASGATAALFKGEVTSAANSARDFETPAITRTAPSLPWFRPGKTDPRAIPDMTLTAARKPAPCPKNARPGAAADEKMIF